MINSTTGSLLLHSFLLIYHPYPPSFHEMIFTLVSISRSLYLFRPKRGHRNMNYIGSRQGRVFVKDTAA